MIPQDISPHSAQSTQMRFRLWQVLLRSDRPKDCLLKSVALFCELASHLRRDDCGSCGRFTWQGHLTEWLILYMLDESGLEVSVVEGGLSVYGELGEWEPVRAKLLRR